MDDAYEATTAGDATSTGSCVGSASRDEAVLSRALLRVVELSSGEVVTAEPSLARWCVAAEAELQVAAVEVQVAAEESRSTALAVVGAAVAANA